MNIQKKHYNRIGIFLLLVFVVPMFILAGCERPLTPPTYDEEVEPVDEVELFGIVYGLDEVNGEIKIRTIGYETEHILTFTGAADVKNKYGDIMPMSDVELGSIVEVVYDANRDKLLSLYMSDEVGISKVEEVSGAVFDYVENTVRINGTTYSMTDDVMAFSDNVQIEINEICSEDQLTVWMYNDKVCAIYVELGHGYVRLSDYASYMGGMVEIGYDVIVPVTEDMLLTVREGTYELRISKDGEVGTKQVKVMKNQETNVSLADIAIQPKEKGSVMFKITPGDAKVYIDGKRVNTEGAIELTYGKHKLNILADGYKSYSGTFTVNFAYKIKEYTLEKTDESSDTKKNDSTTEQGSTKEGSSTTENSKEAGGTTENTMENSTTESSAVKDVSTTTGKKTSNKVILTAPIGASVYFDGEYLGIAPISFTKVTGSHIITFSQTGYLSKSYTVNFTDDGKDVTLAYDNLVLISSLIDE